MELVRAAALGGFFDVAAALRANPDALLRKVGLSRTMLIDPEILLPATAVSDLLEHAARDTGCPTFGLRMAASRTIADLGRISLLLVHQPTLRDALQVLASYRHRINSTLALSIEEAGGIAIVREDFVLSSARPSRQADDLALAVLHGICRAVSAASWRPEQVCFGYEAPTANERAVYQRLFLCPVEFGSDRSGIVLREADLDRPNPHADAGLARHARSLIETVSTVHQRSLAEEVEEQVLLLLPSGRASIATCADALGYNVRTMQRHLDEEGISFSAILDRVRRAQLPRYLANRRLQLTDIAALLGYASQGAFTRWHLRTYQQRPSSARRAAIAGLRPAPPN